MILRGVRGGEFQSPRNRVNTSNGTTRLFFGLLSGSKFQSPRNRVNTSNPGDYIDLAYIAERIGFNPLEIGSTLQIPVRRINPIHPIRVSIP